VITILRGGRVATCDAKDRVFEGDVVIEDGEIRALGPDAGRDVAADHILDARDHAVIPGLIQTHVHLVQALFRGLADDVPLLTWLERFIWPLEAAHDDASLMASAELGLCEMLRAGTTAILDMGTVHGHDVIFDACMRSGIRATSGKAMMDRGDSAPARLRETTAASLFESERLAATWHGKADGRLAYAFAPRFILSCSEALIRGAAEAAKSRGCLVHTHAAEHADERKAVKDALGEDDVAILAKWGVTGPNAVLAHGVQLDDAEIASLAERGTKIVHCPSANLKLGSGIARIDALRRAGVVVGLGADGAPCNNNLDPWVEMRHAALLAKVRSGTTSMPAREVLRMATIDGARVLGQEARIGSLEVGKRADVVVMRLDGAHVAPAYDLFSTLVYACQSRDVAHVLIDGRQIVKDGELSTLDAREAASRARVEALRIGKNASVIGGATP
jgi:cytosine/adenosine deaminase-related metal-dependent hydrolase